MKNDNYDINSSVCRIYIYINKLNYVPSFNFYHNNYFFISYSFIFCFKIIINVSFLLI